ncbi:hypothetical protein L3i22_019740 [Actinoplanes sp. L3-i22]|nr:hypothetical protein L3i22_019740 [Actinoplanes sp. L3-i22]
MARGIPATMGGIISYSRADFVRWRRIWITAYTVVPQILFAALVFRYLSPGEREHYLVEALAYGLLCGLGAGNVSLRLLWKHGRRGRRAGFRALSFAFLALGWLPWMYLSLIVGFGLWDIWLVAWFPGSLLVAAAIRLPEPAVWGPVSGRRPGGPSPR